jgi:glycosyltransferase involved in cell wall biosynthesis
MGAGAHRVVYAVLGSCQPEYQRTLESAVRRHHLENVVSFRGNVSDAALQAHLLHADICINLRYPVTEGASASAIEEMLFGKPVVVTDTGFYSELPSDCVVKLHPEREAELAAILSRLIDDPAMRLRIGTEARRYAEAEFRADRYAAEVLDFAWEVRGARPLLALADRVALECNRMGMSAGMKTVETAAREMSALFRHK